MLAMIERVIPFIYTLVWELCDSEDTQTGDIGSETQNLAAVHFLTAHPSVKSKTTGSIVIGVSKLTPNLIWSFGSSLTLRSLTVASWEKLGRHRDFAAEQGTLKNGVRPVWKLVKSCLDDQRCQEAVEHGQAALERLQEERSEKTDSDRGGKRPAKGDDDRGSRGKRLYADLSDLEESDSPTSTDSEEETRSLIQQLEQTRIVTRKKEKERIERDRSPGRYVTSSPLPSYGIGTAPPPYGASGGPSRSSAPEVWKQDGQDPIWVPERLTRKIQHVAANDEVDMDSRHDDVPVVSTREDGTEMGHPSHVPKTDADQP
ncbi:hypothetical protein STEG23_022865 [Scotinomys teguina]